MQQDSQDYHQHSGSSVSQQGMSLPTPSMQSQIHELAKTLPPPRKQNTACDACRARKVKCNRLPGQDKCQHCLSKNYPCTHYVQQATSEKKRSTTVPRRPRNLSNTSRHAPPIIVPGRPTEYAEGGNSPPSPSDSSSPGPSKLVHTNIPNGGTTISPPPPPPSYSSPLISYKHGSYPPISLQTPTREVLAYIFSPPDSASESGGFSHSRSPYADWGDVASRLEDENFRIEFALDLVEVFFQIVHTRIPLLNPEQFRKRLNLQDNYVSASGKSKALHPALISTVLAWGTKFSEHPLLVADRSRPGGQSYLARALIDRTRELAEAMKVHRIPSPDHVVIALLIEPLQSQNPDDPQGSYTVYIENVLWSYGNLGFHGFWLRSATRNLLDLQINHKSVMANIQDPEARGTMIFAWWMACLADAYSSVYFRRKPILDDDDYDIDFYTADPISNEMGDSHSHMPSPREQLEFLGYYRAAHALARIARQMSRHLWKPTTDSDGISFEVLCTLTTALSEWRDQYLTIVGVPTNFQAEWDFVSAVSACCSDATYHVMWIILFGAVDDFGIREINEVLRIGNPASMAHNHLHIDAIKRKVADEALHGALRISGLAGVLTSNGYLRLDPAVMHISCIQSGTLLARLGRPEVMNCVAGLMQYSYSYEEAGDQALEMKRIYGTVRAGESDLNHMASVVPRMNADGPASHDMVVDHSDGRGNGRQTPEDILNSMYGR